MFLLLLKYQNAWIVIFKINYILGLLFQIKIYIYYWQSFFEMLYIVNKKNLRSVFKLNVFIYTNNFKEMDKNKNILKTKIY